jgi:gas vesicle protein
MDYDKQQSSHENPKKHELSIDEQQAGFVLGAVMGAVVGGAAALLLSPKSGKEMRDLVKQYAKDIESEAYDLAKESKGVAKSFKSVLEEGATEVMEQAPEHIEKAGYQAQQLADDLSHRFESARDMVAELADAFKSGWEEYGDDHPADELERGAPALIADDVPVAPKVVEPSPVAVEPATVKREPAVVEDAIDEILPPSPMQARRRTHADTTTTFSMHANNKDLDVVEVVEKKEEVVKKESPKSTPGHSIDSEVKPAKEAVDKAKPEEPKPDAEVKQSAEEKVMARPYTTRVIEEPRKVVSRASKSEPIAETEAKPKKKLLFRRTAK